MARFHFVDQGTAEWWELRRGKPTASQFHRILTPAGKPSGQARGYMYKLIAERLLGEIMEDQRSAMKSVWVEHGKLTEAEAITKFQDKYKLILQSVGFVTSNDYRIGCSPDCLVKGSVEAVEIKCPAPWTQIGYILDGPGEDYKPQVQGELLVGEWDKVHFFSYHPRMPAKYIETGRDEAYLKLLEDALHAFCDVLDEETENCRAMGDWLPNLEANEWPRTGT
jgi:hypothetical protein